MTLERRIGELSGRVTVASDPAIFPQAFVAMNALGSVNRSIDAIDVQRWTRALRTRERSRSALRPDIEAQESGSYGEVRVEPNGAIVVSYIGNPAVLDRLAQFSSVLAGSDATRFEFGMTGAV